MKKHSPKKHVWPYLIHRYCLFLFLSQVSVPAYTQCGPPPELPGTQCESAPLLCLQNFCSETSTNFINCCVGFCGPNTAVHNPQYFQFIPITPTVEFSISVDYCSGGIGLQAVIIAACPWTNGDVLDCNPEGYPGTTMYLSATDLIVGQPHWLLLDGSAGAFCGFTITEAIGIQSNELIGDIDTLIVQWDTIQPGRYHQLMEAKPEIILAHGYLWEIESLGLSFTTQTVGTAWDVPCDIIPGEYEICVSAFSGCDTSEIPVCNTFYVNPIVDRIKTPGTFCSDDFPFYWHQHLIEGPGMYSQTFSSPDGCMFDSLWQVEAFPEYPDPDLDTLLCQGHFQFGDSVYTASGTYMYHYPGQGAHGCDSSVMIHLTVDSVGFFIETVHADTALYLHPVLYYQDTAVDSVTYQWYSCDMNTLLSDSSHFAPDTSGCYCLILVTEHCADTVCSSFTVDPASLSCDLVQGTACALTSVALEHNIPQDSSAVYYWTISSSSGHDAFIIDRQSTEYTFDLPGTYVVRLTITDSVATHSCRDTIDIYPGPVVSPLQTSGNDCDTCVMVSLQVHESPSWSMTITGGTDELTFSGITDTVFQTVVCPVLGQSVLYEVHVTDDSSGCPGLFTATNTFETYQAPILNATITETMNTLCAIGENATSFRWTRCGFTSLLAVSPCYAPADFGCYCVEMSNALGCQDTVCYVYGNTSLDDTPSEQIQLYPTVSRQEWTVHLPDRTDRPVQWSMVDTHGRIWGSGTIVDSPWTLSPEVAPPPGIYFFQMMSASGFILSAKVIVP